MGAFIIPPALRVVADYDFAVEERLESSLIALATEYAGILVKLLQAKGELVGEIELSPYARYKFPFHIYICGDGEEATVDVGDEVLIQEHGQTVNDAMLKISERYEFPDVVLDSIFRNISERLVAKAQLKIAEKLGRWATLKAGLPRRLTSQDTVMVH